ncbi:MAG: adenylate/guanylate cyclase domain-containing protein [Chloroflexota bacterium]
MRSDLPSGTVTFLFTDIEGSTRLLHALGAEAYADALAEHRRILRAAFTTEGGVEVDTQGDAFFVAFPTAPGALAAAAAGTEALAPGPIHVRMAIHTGTPFLGPEGYVGVDVHRGARIGAAGHGGQVLVSAASAALLGSDGLRDLGPHRLKDLSAPEHIYQLGDADFPALKTLYRTNLPVPATPFLGRGRELREVISLLSQPILRVLTLTGPGGTGKSRLALQAAAELTEQYAQGVWWVPLAAIRDPGLVLEMLAGALGAKSDLAEHIGDRSMLIVLDNFEQVVEAAGDLAGLLAACPHLDLLVTSREPLHINGEHEYPVPPLAPDEGVALFVARARAVRPDFVADESVAQVCRRLDDLPLAIELAAARVKALSTRQILERLEQRLPLLTGGARDLPERQRTLRAAIAWSHDLLDADEQRLFARLAVFRGGCTLDAAEAVIDADLDQLQSLVDKSLLRHTEERFWMLETIREYAAEQLETSGQAEELRERQAEYFQALAEESEAHLESDEPAAWLARLEAEHDNLRAALDWLAASGSAERVLEMAGALAYFWEGNGYPHEARGRLEDGLSASTVETPARARALLGAAAIANAVGDSAAAVNRAEEALRLHRSLGDQRGIANSLWQLGYSLANSGQGEAAIPLLEQSIGLFRDLGDERFARFVTRTLGFALIEAGEVERGEAIHEQNLAAARQYEDRRLEAISLASLAMSIAGSGRTARALALLGEAYPLVREFGERDELLNHLCRFALALALAGRGGVAVRLLAAATTQREKIGSRVRWVDAMNAEARHIALDALDDAAFAEAWAAGETLTLDEAFALALDHSALG